MQYVFRKKSGFFAVKKPLAKRESPSMCGVFAVSDFLVLSGLLTVEAALVPRGEFKA
jgi:hypothetical protein